MDTKTALLRAILDNPADDLPRLVYADWCDEHGEPERAEFVRLQIALHHSDPDRPTFLIDDGDRAKLAPAARREQEIWAAAVAAETVFDWFPVFPGRTFTSMAGVGHLWDGDPDTYESDGGIRAVARRGFVDLVACPLSYWLEHGPRVVREHPVREVRVTDREPLPNRYGGTSCSWTFGDPPVRPSDVPYSLIRGMCESGGDTPDGRSWVLYASRNAALADLSKACLAWAKSQATQPAATSA
jgi:uncharacterized protein (TIGR02996 family)